MAPLSIRVIDVSRLSAAPGLKASARTLENAYVFAEIGDDGAIARLVEKRSGRQALEGRGNQLWVYPQDKPREWDAWDIDEDYFARSEELRGAESIALVENGLHFAAIRVARRYKNSTITQTYRLAANAHWLEIETFLDWRDRRTLLRSLTPAAVRANYASCECAYGMIERPTHRNTSWQEAMFEAVAHRFIDLSEPGFGLALINDGKYGHSVRDNVLGLSLVRSPVYPDPLADEGEQRFTYALCPHSLPLPMSGVREAADALNQPLLSGAGEGRPGDGANPAPLQLVVGGAVGAQSGRRRKRPHFAALRAVWRPRRSGDYAAAGLAPRRPPQSHGRADGARGPA